MYVSGIIMIFHLSSINYRYYFCFSTFRLTFFSQFVSHKIKKFINMASVFFEEVRAENTAQELWRQCEREEFCDVLLIAGTEEIKIPVHRNILSASTDYFKKMFTVPMRERNAGEIKVSDVDGEIFKLLVKFCYTGRVEITEDNVQKLLENAHLLLLGTVVNACSNFLGKHLHITNCLGFSQLAERYNCESLLKQAKDYSLDHFMDLYKTDEFLNLNSEQLGQLLGSDNLKVEAEENVFASLMAWMNHDRISREKYIDELLKLVRMPLIEPYFLINQVKSVCSSTECHKLYVEAMEWHSAPACVKLNSSSSTKQRRKANQTLMAMALTEGNKAEILYYNPNELKWIKWLHSLDYRSEFGSAVMDDHIYIVGGLDVKANALNTVICLNLKTMTFEQVKPMTKHRAHCGAAVLKGYLYAVGGFDKKNVISSVEKFDRKTNTWIEVAPMSVKRCNFGIAELNGKIYVVGGYSNGQEINSSEYYDPDQNMWTSIAQMNTVRELPGVAVAGGLLYAICGNEKKSVERYDCATNKWTTLCSLSKNLKGLETTVYQNRVMVTSNGRIEEYNPNTNEWKLNASIKGLLSSYYIFSYSGELLMSQFGDT